MSRTTLFVSLFTFFAPRNRGAYRHFRADFFFFGRSPTQGNARTKAKKMFQLKNAKYFNTIIADGIGDVKGPRKHNRLYYFYMAHEDFVKNEKTSAVSTTD